MKSRKLIIGLALAAAVTTGAGVAMASNEDGHGREGRTHQEAVSPQGQASRDADGGGRSVGGAVGEMATAEGRDEMDHHAEMGHDGAEIVKSVLDGLVKNGTLSTEQAEKVATALQEAHDQMRPRGPRGERRRDVRDAPGRASGDQGDGEIVPDGGVPETAPEGPASR